MPTVTDSAPSQAAAPGAAPPLRFDPWLLVVVAAFCLPLFIGLGRTDLENDEAIYSYAVDSILETGHWLSPLSSPSDSIVFVEKPPLKFWIVALPLRLGLLPHDEFGLRFWDAVFGGLAFIYVYLLGRRLAGTWCGVTAVLILFAQHRLLFEHGLRSNNMEAALFLTYCGGFHHFLRYAAPGQPHRVRHLAAVAALFLLGFMTKFVAALFLPFVLGIATLIVPRYRRVVTTDLGRWILAAAAVLAAAAPWFVYQHVITRGRFWRIILGEHVITRFTAYTDPAHLHPWYFYFRELFAGLQAGRATPLVAVGLVALTLHTIRGRRADGLVLLLWFAVPLSLISLGTSKLYHYAYPFLPPVALAGGYGAAEVVGLVRRVLAPALSRRGLRLIAPSSRTARAALIAVAVAALAIAAVTAVQGPIDIEASGHTVFRNRSVIRPLVVASVATGASGHAPAALGAAAIWALGLVVPLPLNPYLNNLAELNDYHQPLRSLTTCLERVDDRRRTAGERVLPVYGLSTDDDGFLHSYFYYLRHAGGWEEPQAGDDRAVARALFDPEAPRPVVIGGASYSQSLERHPPSGPLPRGIRLGSILILLPGPYADCAAAVPGGGQ